MHWVPSALGMLAIHSTRLSLIEYLSTPAARPRAISSSPARDVGILPGVSCMPPRPMDQLFTGSSPPARPNSARAPTTSSKWTSCLQALRLATRSFGSSIRMPSFLTPSIKFGESCSLSVVDISSCQLIGRATRSPSILIGVVEKTLSFQLRSCSVAVSGMRPARRSHPSQHNCVSWPGIPMKVREVIRLLEKNGWVEMRSRGSHRHFKHPQQAFVITVTWQPRKGTGYRHLEPILKKAGLK